MEDLRHWLQLAAWEGDIFTDQVLAYALGKRDEEEYERFQIVLDEALRCGVDGQGVLEELEETVELATADLERPLRYLGQYRIVPPILRTILWNQQIERERAERGRIYVGAMEQAYASHLGRVAARLIYIYEALGEFAKAEAVRAQYLAPSFLDAISVAALRELAVDDDSKRVLAWRIVDDFGTSRHYRHSHELLAGMLIAHEIATELRDRVLCAATFNDLGFVYDALGDKRRRWRTTSKRCPSVARWGRRGEATTLNNIGTVYSALGDKPQALAYYEQALP